MLGGAFAAPAVLPVVVVVVPANGASTLFKNVEPLECQI